MASVRASRLHRHSLLIGAAMLATALLPHDALAWGRDGHRIIADIAEQFLDPQAVRQVRALLAVENATALADVASWADDIRRQRPETARWHFVDIPVHPAAGEPSGYDPARDCPRGACVVAKIVEFERVLTDREAPERQRLEALKFVVHFVGDVHQPLHAADDNDRGGNDVRVTFLGRKTNLHAVWDTGIIETAARGDDRGYALRLASGITAAERERWSQGTPAAWADEAHGVAVRSIYGTLPHAGVLPPSYAADALPLVDAQLERAGVRLAAVLNAALGN